MFTTGLMSLVIALATFVASHWVLSHPLREPLRRRVGAGAFQLIYTAVALATLIWAVQLFKAQPPAPLLWDGSGLAPWLLASVLTLVASTLLVASLVGNPALGAGARSLTGLAGATPRGVFTVTRHPMMMGIALWALAHALVAPSPRTLVLTAAMVVLALGGVALQDRKYAALHGADWQAWMDRTPFWPAVARFGALGWAWAGGAALWLMLTWAHLPAGGIAAGAWRWLAP